MPANGLVIDIDAHVYEPGGMWQKYIDKEYRDQAPRTIFDARNKQRMLVEGRILPQPEGKGAGLPNGLYESLEKRVVYDQQGNLRIPREGVFKTDYIVEDLDRGGIDAMVCFPGEGLFICDVRNPGLAAAMCRAYNTWVSEYLSAQPSRLFAVAVLPLQDVDQAVKEITRAVEKLGLVGGLIPSTLQGQRNLDDPVFEPLFEAAQALDVPIMIHVASGLSWLTGSPRFENWAIIRSFLHPFEQILAAHSLTIGGVLEKFPRLRVCFLEAGSGWVPFWLQRLDESHELLPHDMPSLTMPPSKYFLRQCFVSCEAEERMLPDAVRNIGDNKILFASDYPHWDSTFPNSVRALRERSDLSDQAKSKILGQNALQLLGPRFAKRVATLTASASV